MFGDLVALFRFLHEVASNRSPKKTGCLALLDLYRALGEVIDNATTVVAPFNLYSLAELPPAPEAHIAAMNRRAERLARSVRKVAGLMQSQFAAALEVHDPDLVMRIRFHLDYKSFWYHELGRLYREGVVDLPSRKLRRHVLRLAEVSEISEIRDAGLTGQGLGHGFGDEDKALFMRSFFRSEQYDLTDERAVSALISRGRANVEALSTVHGQLGKFIKANCKIGDLLRP